MPEFTSPTLWLLGAAVLGYLLGSVPFGLLVTRAMGLGDVRSIGSGNIGATNVLRTGNKAAALATLLLDGGKAAVAVLLGRALLGEDGAQVAGLASFLGHLFPIYLGFKGGKGVASFLGLMLALAWPVGLACCGTWLLVAVVLRYSSLSALVAACAAPVWAFLFLRFDVMVLATVVAVLVVVRHRTNIARLRAGTEPKIGQKG